MGGNFGHEGASSPPERGKFAATVWRIGLMGYNARPDAVLFVLAALEDALKNA